MIKSNLISRRTLVKSSIFGVLAASIPSISYAQKITQKLSSSVNGDLFHRYPSIDDSIVAEVVGASHFNLDRVKELVDKRPELSRATWDWAFGDWETAIGAASHVGRRDIVAYLMSKGARPDIFTYAMLGEYEVVRGMIEATPGVEEIAGPHGISLLRHAEIGSRNKDLTTVQKEQAQKLVTYLQELGNAGGKSDYLEMAEDDKEKYLGDYMYGEGPNDGFSIKLNMRKMIALGKLGQFGGGLLMLSENRFTYNGTPSVEISFTIENDRVIALTVHEPDLTLVAKKV